MRTYRHRRLAVTAGVLLSTSALTFPTPAGATTPVAPRPAAAVRATLPCATPVDVPGQGPSCPVDGGWLIPAPGGGVVFTHGPDPAPSGPVASPGHTGGPNAIPSDPVCVTTSQYGVRVIYATPPDVPNQYATRLSTIRSTVREVNGRVNEAGLDSGNKRVDVRVVCDATGAISVANETLTTPSGSASYWTISDELAARGYNSSLHKYLVFYEADVPGICGQATIDGDERPTADNANNVGPDFAITYSAFSGCAGSRVPLHELIHALGGAQHGAPHASGGWHCNDGADVLCYNDGGPNACYGSDFYCVNTCFDYEHMDCGHDTYFHAAPPSSNWLATHWNLGSTANRFFQVASGTVSEWQQEAEAFASRPVGGQCSSSSASGGLCWNIWANGSISTTTASLTAGTKRVSVRALGDPAAGVWPNMKVYVNGVQVMDVAVSQNVWSTYSAAITLPAGSHTIQVQFTNDANVNGDDRNLLVDYARVNNAGQTWMTEAESFTTKTAGGLTPSSGASGGAYWNLWSNGYIEHSMSVPYTSQHEIQVVARGDVAGGVWPEMKVYVDGTLVLTQTVATTSWTKYPIRRVLTGGSHTLRIQFTNDAMVGTEDRNLKLDYAALYS